MLKHRLYRPVTRALGANIASCQGATETILCERCSSLHFSIYQQFPINLATGDKFRFFPNTSSVFSDKVLKVGWGWGECDPSAWYARPANYCTTNVSKLTWQFLFVTRSLHDTFLQQSLCFHGVSFCHHPACCLVHVYLQCKQMFNSYICSCLGKYITVTLHKRYQGKIKNA